MPSKPIDILNRMILYVGADSMRRKVGDYIKHLSPKDRETLSKLTSKDTLNQRLFWK